MISDLVGRARRLFSGLGFSTGRRALRWRVFPSLVHGPILHRTHPDTVIDVGANRGQFTLDVIRVLPATRVFAFEPFRGEADVFEKIFAASPNVQLDRRGVVIGGPCRNARVGGGGQLVDVSHRPTSDIDVPGNRGE